ncbi:hypothetical protein PENSOL_c164G00439 [Penicillium solitum]|uniref:Uncharacterized protein n=1 Tax=Penicillium solitum TaxID=60172 RepID=A0A1V6Q188_9EURO|nr:uncharacterized protein PENSOL_c164G00439 [Penicillium solitum]OQD82989.1 hypothetical protein PENSOL_c164G00439 [Penicillium solitum]
MLLEVVSLFIGYERGLTIARYHQNGSNALAGPNEMDLSVVTSRPPALQPTKETRSCHNYGKPGHLARNEAGGKLARPHDVEALVGRLQQAPKQPQFDAEDLLDPHHSESTPSRARLETLPQRGTARLRKPKIPLWVTIANGERLETAGFAILPVKLGEWTGRIKAHVVRALRKKNIEARLFMAILEKYKNLFRLELPTALPPERNVAHEVETGAARPMNINAYALSAEKLDE